MPWLHWLTRDEDIKEAKVAPYRLLEAMPELSADDPQSPNMLIQGDNLKALKALLLSGKYPRILRLVVS